MNIVDSFIESYNTNPDDYTLDNQDFTNSKNIDKRIIISHKFKKFSITYTVKQYAKFGHYNIKINEQFTLSSERLDIKKEDREKLDVIFSIIPKFDGLERIKLMKIEELENKPNTNHSMYAITNNHHGLAKIVLVKK